jgi:hypothetical protein
MTKHEFRGHFKRLCEGFRYDPTAAQFEAFYERLKQYDVRDWTEAVTTLLCGARFPVLDPMLDTLEKMQAARRRDELEADKAGAARVYHELMGDPVDIQAPSFRARKAFAGRKQAREMLDIWAQRDFADERIRAKWLTHYEDEILRAEREIDAVIGKLEPNEVRALLEHYEGTP